MRAFTTAFLEALQKEGGYLVSGRRKSNCCRRRCGTRKITAPSNTIARPASVIAEIAGFAIPDGKTFLIVPETHIGKDYLFLLRKTVAGAFDHQI